MPILSDIVAHNYSSSEPDNISIDSRAGVLEWSVTLAGFQDSNTGQWVVYCPSLEISGYGETTEHALELMRFNLEEYFHYLLELSYPEVITELKSLNWGPMQSEEGVLALQAEFNIEDKCKELGIDIGTIQFMRMTA